MSKGSKAPKKRRSRLLALEPRVLFDGAAVDAAATLAQAVATDATAQPADPLLEALDQAVPAAVGAPADTLQPVEWLVIDAAVPDAAQLAADARDGVRVLMLDASRDGLAQIRDAVVAGGAPVSALHIVSHGAPGYIVLGNSALDNAQLAARASELQALQPLLTADADVLLYGCDVALGAVGEAFVQELARLTGADVAASTDATGGAAVEGDWVF